MKIWHWKYIDLSPNNGRDIKWEFGIPYLLKASGSLFRPGFSFHLWFLCFGIDWITDCSCGKVNRIRFWKWYISFILRRGWSFEFHIGIDRGRISDWKIKRLMRKMTPEEWENHIKRLIEFL